MKSNLWYSAFNNDYNSQQIRNVSTHSQYDKRHLQKNLQVALKVKSLLRVRLFVDPMDCSLPGSSLHGILQARVLVWVAISFSRGSSQLRDWTRVSHIPGKRFNLWTTKEADQMLNTLPSEFRKRKWMSINTFRTSKYFY